MIFDCALSGTTGNVRILFRCLSRKQFPLKRIWFYSASQRVDRIHELVDVLKALVNRRVTQVSDFIDPAQFLEHSRADQ
jgi:hypothetical protein